MKSLFLFVIVACFVSSNSGYSQSLTLGKDTISVNVKLLAIDSFTNIVPAGGKENLYFLLLDVNRKDMHLLSLDTVYCKNRIVAEYYAFNVDNLKEGQSYNVKLTINKTNKVLNEQEEVITRSYCSDLYLKFRFDIQYWIIDIVPFPQTTSSGKGKRGQKQ
jgi:hypothetical protein